MKKVNLPPAQLQKLISLIRNYKKTYLIKKYEKLDESATRIMINSFLTTILGYTELEEVKSEYAIKGTYADYIIQVNRKKHFVVEVKSIQIDLSEQHLRQSLSYAANEGIDWILLTNGNQFELYRVLFGKPISTKKIFSINLSTEKNMKMVAEAFSLLTKKSVLAKELESYWIRFQALEPINLAKLLYAPDAVKTLRRLLREKTGITFGIEDMYDSIYDIIVLEIPSTKPKIITSVKKVVKPLLVQV